MEKSMNKNEQRFKMWLKVVQENRTKRQTVDSIWFQYLEQLNKVTFASEIEDVLDAIIENERRLGHKI